MISNYYNPTVNVSLWGRKARVCNAIGVLDLPQIFHVPAQSDLRYLWMYLEDTEWEMVTDPIYPSEGTEFALVVPCDMCEEFPVILDKSLFLPPSQNVSVCDHCRGADKPRFDPDDPEEPLSLDEAVDYIWFSSQNPISTPMNSPWDFT